MTFNVNSRALFIAALSTSLWCAEALAHGEAVLCDVQGDIVEQCGEAHDCVTDPEVSEAIGYCKAEAEDISFTLCDRGAESPTCMMDEVCKIGTIDPNIGVCAAVAELPEDSAGEEAQSSINEDAGHDHSDHDHGDHEHGGDDDHGDHDHGCQSAAGGSSLPSLMGLGLVFGLLLRRPRHRLQRTRAA